MSVFHLFSLLSVCFVTPGDGWQSRLVSVRYTVCPTVSFKFLSEILLYQFNLHEKSEERLKILFSFLHHAFLG